MNNYLEILKQANARTLDECISLLVKSGLNTVNHNDMIIQTIGVYLRDMIIKRLVVTPTRTFVSVLCSAMKFPEDVIIDCLQHMSDDGIIEFSEDRDYVVWIGSDPVPGLWNNAYLSSLNEIVWETLISIDAKNKQDNGE